MPRRGLFRETAGISFPYPFKAPAVPWCNGTITTIQRVEASLPGFMESNEPTGTNVVTPVAVSLGPYHSNSSFFRKMGEAKRAALDEFCRVVKQPLKAVQEKIFPVALSARGYYAYDFTLDGNEYGYNDEDGGSDSGIDNCRGVDVDAGVQMLSNSSVDGDGNDNADEDDGDLKFARMMLLDGCFLLQFMVSMCPEDPDAPPGKDPLMSRAEVLTSIDAIARDVMLLENQIPWTVLEALMELRPGVPVDRFLALMATAFDVGNDVNAAVDDQDQHAVHLHGDEQPRLQPPHLLGLFYRRQVGPARTETLRVPRLSSLSSTAVELAEMGVKLTASKTKKFGDMSMVRRQSGGLRLFGELSLAPMVLNEVTACWLVNMAAYEACLGAALPDNFAVSSFISVVALLMNREEDVQELRSKGIVSSAMSDMGTMEFFKWAAPHLRVGHRYYEVFQGLQEYRQKRWLWIAIHRFFFNNFKTIVAVLSGIGVVVGLFKTILSLKQPQR